MSSTTKNNIALLGSTGSTGRVVLSTLLARNTHRLHIHVRSRSKLLSLFPGLDHNPSVTIHEGSATDIRTLTACLSPCPIIICTLGGTGFEPSSILVDSARAVLSVLRDRQASDPKAYQRPRMIYLGSATQNPRFAAQRPALLHWLVHTAFRLGYIDLEAAEDMYDHEPELLSLLKVEPGMLVTEPGTGYEISAEKIKDACAYEDLGRGFVELALERGYDGLDRVGVGSKGGEGARLAPIGLYRMTLGFFVNFFPGGMGVAKALGLN